MMKKAVLAAEARLPRLRYRSADWSGQVQRLDSYRKWKIYGLNFLALRRPFIIRCLDILSTQLWQMRRRACLMSEGGWYLTFHKTPNFCQVPNCNEPFYAKN